MGEFTIPLAGTIQAEDMEEHMSDVSPFTVVDPNGPAKVKVTKPRPKSTSSMLQVKPAKLGKKK